MSPFRRPVTPDQLAQYRTPSLMAVVLAHILPTSFGCYLWYRRAKGGRWTRLHTTNRYMEDGGYVVGSEWTPRWVQVPCCPATNGAAFTEKHNQLWECKTSAASGFTDPCACEVWGTR